MDLAHRLVAPAARVVGPSQVELDLEAFVFRLILFDHYVFSTFRLMEIPSLVRALSHDGLISILESGAISIDSFPVQTASLGPSLFVKDPAPASVRPPFHYSLATVTPTDQLDHTNFCLENVFKTLAPTKHQQVRLRRAIYGCLTKVDDQVGEMALRATGEELPKNAELLAFTCSLAAKKKLGIILDPAAIRLSPTRLTDYDYRVDNELEDTFHLSQLDAHTVIESGILAIAQRNDRIEQMKRYNAVSGFSDDDLPVFGQKLAFVEASLSPKVKEERLRRVIELRGLPSIADQNQIAINAKRLLQIRDSPECVEFRNWLANADEASDEEIEGFSRSISTRIGTFIRSSTGRTLRFLCTTGAGIIPMGGLIAGPVISAIDQFLLEKVFPYSGPVAFIDSMYPSIFESHQ
jgi:hypothetical protein